MNKKLTLVLIILCLVGAISIATAAKPDPKPDVWAAIANLQAAVDNLWGNATAQQDQIKVLQDQSPVHFGEWNDTLEMYMPNGFMFTAPTDGFVVMQVWTTDDYPSPWRLYSNTNDGPVAHSVWVDVQEGYSGGTITMPVRKGETWSGDINPIDVPIDYDISWLPITP